MKALMPQDLDWLEGRIPTHRWTIEDRRRLIADLRAAREPWLAGMWQGPALTAEEMVAHLTPKEPPCP